MVEKSIDDIIRDECLPMRDCMLTLQDFTGEAAFLYFKDSELIEANYAALWGKDALAQILMWQLSGYNVAPLPLGIKRSLWEPLETLMNPKLVPTASGRIPVLKSKYVASKKEDDYAEFANFKKIAGVMKMILIDDGKIELKVKETRGEDVICEVVYGGVLKSRKGINLPYSRVSAPSLTEKDITPEGRAGNGAFILRRYGEGSRAAECDRFCRCCGSRGLRSGECCRCEDQEGRARCDDA